jgi:hypothetical protein
MPTEKVHGINRVTIQAYPSRLHWKVTGHNCIFAAPYWEVSHCTHIDLKGTTDREQDCMLQMCEQQQKKVTKACTIAPPFTLRTTQTKFASIKVLLLKTKELHQKQIIATHHPHSQLHTVSLDSFLDETCPCTHNLPASSTYKAWHIIHDAGTQCIGTRCSATRALERSELHPLADVIWRRGGRARGGPQVLWGPTAMQTCSRAHHSCHLTASCHFMLGAQKHYFVREFTTQAQYL